MGVVKSNSEEGMEQKANKPRLVFFQWCHEGLPKFLQLHMRLHVKCLSEFFEVVLVNKDCDYQQICDMYQPDLTLFESGYRTSISQKIKISNTSTNLKIPKLGLHNGDAWCECRSGFISDMEHWGIETYFTIGITTADHTPELSENLFVWPNFIDTEIYHDYHLPKMVPVLFNGYMNSLYPWRKKIFKILSNSYPSLIFPHLGYESRSSIMIYGEQYARTINASWFVPTCGTLANEVVRKHFEIPAAKSCLVTEKTPALVAAGFIDMQNCVFADENNVSEKVGYLLQNTNELEQITNAGYELVHSRHSLKQRDEIFQWFTLNKNRKPSERIVMTNPFRPLSLVETASGIKNSHIKCDGLNLKLLCQGDEKLWTGKYDEAEVLYLKCLNYIHWMAEPKIKLAICNLYKGKPQRAHVWILDPIQNNLSSYRAFDPDPVEWAYFIIILLCEGNLNEAIIRISQFPTLSHPELDRTRCIVNYLKENGNIDPKLVSETRKVQFSIHQLPKQSFGNWIYNVCVMLKSCGQTAYAEQLAKIGFLADHSLEKPRIEVIRTITNSKKYFVLIRVKWLESLNYFFKFFRVPNERPGLPPISEIDYIIRLCRWAGMDTFKRFILKYLPTISAAKIENNEFSGAIEFLLGREEVRTKLIIRSSNNDIVTKSISKSYHPDESIVFCININNPLAITLDRNQKADFDAKIYDFEPNLGKDFSIELNNYIHQVKEDNRIKFFDLVLIDAPDISSIDLEELMGAKFIIFNSINSYQTYRYKHTITLDPCYFLIDGDPTCDNGYAIFKKKDSERKYVRDVLDQAIN